MIKIEDGGLTGRLAEIQRRSGGRRKWFNVYPLRAKIDGDASADEIKTLFHPSGFLIKNGNPVFARAHAPESPAAGLHFTVCRSLRAARGGYHITNRDDEPYAAGGAEEEDSAPLPCPHCLARLDYRCFNISDNQSAVAAEFNAQDALDLMREQLAVFNNYARLLRGGAAGGGGAGHKTIAGMFRRIRNYICAGCGVDVSSWPALCDMHHLSGDSRNHVFDNLQCLCKLCHQKAHAHYFVDSLAARQISRLRKEQGIDA